MKKFKDYLESVKGYGNEYLGGVEEEITSQPTPKQTEIIKDLQSFVKENDYPGFKNKLEVEGITIPEKFESDYFQKQLFGVNDEKLHDRLFVMLISLTSKKKKK
jgi:hypothetical protein